MALLRNAPWNWAQLIVDETGKATPEFLAWLQQQLTISKVAGEAVPQSRLIDTGLGLSGGGDLSSDRILVLDAVIDDLNDVDTVTNPPVDGQALIWDNLAGDWVPGDVATSLEVEEDGVSVATDVNLLNFAGSAVTVTDDGGGAVTIDIIGGGGGGSIYGPVSNGTTPGPVLLDNGAGECILAEVP